MKIAVLIVAAGRGRRAETAQPKQWQLLAGQSVLAHTCNVFQAHASINQLMLVLHRDDLAQAERLAGIELADIELTEGGATRNASVRAGLEALAADKNTGKSTGKNTGAPDLVLIHDVARPLVSAALIDRVIAALANHQGAAPALAVSDALWRGTAGLVSGRQNREHLYRAQTPQGFHFAAILAAHRIYAGVHKGNAADDVEVARAAGLEVAIVAGDEANMKITLPDDFDRAETLLRNNNVIDKDMNVDIRCGSGFDVHAFCPGDHVILCGIRIPHEAALLGHSDADVAMHALSDAIYGALAEGDIGRHFPPSEPAWKGAESHIFLTHAAELARQRGYIISNVDVTLICEAPKIGPHAPAMQAELARILKLAPDRVSVKATTSEGLGFTGRREGIAAQAMATLVKA